MNFIDWYVRYRIINAFSYLDGKWNFVIIRSSWSPHKAKTVGVWKFNSMTGRTGSYHDNVTGLRFSVFFIRMNIASYRKIKRCLIKWVFHISPASFAICYFLIQARDDFAKLHASGDMNGMNFTFLITECVS